MIDSDLLATYYSGTYHSDGYALVAGTGAVCARVRNYRLDRVVDGVGWLLGDEGSGFWLGHRAVRAVAADLDGRAPRTAITGPLLERLDIAISKATHEGRPAALQSLIQAVYALRPIELASFAVLVFEAARAGDVVAHSLLQRAGAALSRSLSTARIPEVKGPVVLGGSILSAGSVIDDELSGHLGDLHPVRVPDGLAGAALLALRHADLPVGKEVFERIAQSLGELRS
ncbi:N-acetylglucosamine kinase-like BadF-type ATPase [Psychromicrobium silvestre]|uniref:N-acetylglucosamine kinase-like BadF-type ATPase n=2 Tax=Psychromicrobium silvestre TaxID=1645614 RepID=A0A7Y9LUS2_9MICC|nr:N-acetylglucosamine kinase-like BadF-type ATPase [Psychromicrobium silvestre]